MHVIGTAGHVDHGKSSLVHALTGIDPDRLREEKEREMTIDLGFAWLTLPNGEPVGIIDVPGHRDFVENMLAGVGGIDAALFVVAVDEGVMPQTREHLAILDLLEVSAGVVALTKADLAESEDWTEMVMAVVSETLEGTALEDAPIIPVSARTRQGFDELLNALQESLAQAQPRADRGRPRLPIDRVFTISGFGTVVTGTLIDGSFEVGQAVEVQPKGLKARVRGLQTHREKVQRALPGSRVAMNLTGVSRSDVKRGDVVTIPGWLRGTLLSDVQIRYLATAARPLRHNTELKLFSGAAETLARVRLLGQDEVQPGEMAWAQLRLTDPVALTKGDRFILRVPSPPSTVGGGVILDPNPGRRYRRFRADVIERLEQLAQGDPGDIIVHILIRRGPTPAREVLSADIPGDAPAEVLAQMLAEGRVIALGAQANIQNPATSGQLVVTRVWWTDLTERFSRLLSSYHQRYPLRAGMGREALRSGLRLDPKVFNASIVRASAGEILVDEGATIRLPAHAVRFSPEQQRKVDGLLASFRGRPYATPSVKESIAIIGEDVLGVLLARGELVKVSSDVLFLPGTYDQMVARIRATIESEGSITLAQTRDLFSTSRKYAQSILEYLDATGVTKRVGDARILPG